MKAAASPNSTESSSRDLEAKCLELEARVHALEAELQAHREAEANGNQDSAVFRALFDNTKDAVLIYNLDGFCTMMNRRAVEMLGYSEAEYLGKPFGTASAPEIPGTAQRIFAALLEGENIPLYERTMRHKDGTTFPAEISLALVRDENGAPRHVQSLIRDITTRIQASVALQEQNNLLRTLVENLPDSVYIKDRASHFILNNSNHASYRNQIPASMVGKTDFDFFPRELAERYYADEQRIIETGEPIINQEEPTVDGEGAPRWVMTSKVPLRDRSGQIIGIVGVSHDITEMRVHQQQLEDSERFIQKITNTIPDMLYVYDRVEKRYVYANYDKIEQTLGYDPETLASLRGANLRRQVHRDDLPFFEARIETLNLAADDEMVETEFRLRHANGAWRWVYSRDRVFTRDETGRPRRILGIVQDVTDDKWVEERLLRQNEYLRSLSEIAPALMNRLDPSELLRVILARTAALINASDAFIDLVEPDGQHMREFAKLGHFEHFQYLATKGEGLVGTAWERDNMVVIDDYATWEGRIEISVLNQLHAAIAVPLRAGGEVLGVMCLALLEANRRFTEDEIAIVNRVAELSSIALDNARLYSAAQQELTERNRAEAALRESEERYRSVIMAMNEGILLQTRDGKQTYNASALRILEMDDAVRFGEPLVDFHHPMINEDGSIFPEEQHPVVTTLRTGNPVSDVVFGIYRSDGSICWVLANSQPLFSDGETTPYAAVATFADITERKKAEAALKASEERYRAVVEEQSEIIARFLPDTTLSFVNDAYCDYFGKTREELIGRSFLWLVPEEDHFDVLAYMRSLTRDNPARTAEHRARIPNGVLRWLQWSDRAIFNAAGEVVEYQTVARDITERKQAEEALRLSEARYRAVVENQTELICRYLPNRTLTFVNDAICKYNEMSREEIVGLDFIDQVYEEDRPHVEAQISQLSPDGLHSVSYEHRWVRRNGEVRWQQWTDSLILDEHNNIIEYQSVGRDITERREAEDALHKERSLLRTLIDTIPDAIYVKDRDSRFLLSNPECAKGLGAASVDDLKGKSDFDFIDAKFAQNYYAQEQEIMRTGQPLQYEEQAVDMQGRLVWTFQTKLPFRNSYGEIDGLVGVNRNITAVKLAEAELQNERDFVRAILSTAVTMISVVDLEGRIVSFNRACEAVSGYTFAEVEGKSFWDLFIAPDERPALQATFRELESGNYPLKHINHWNLRDGTRVLIEWSITVLFDASGRMTHFVSTGVDISTRKELEERKLELAVEREKVKIIGNFIRDASHDFRTPLSILNTNLYLLRKTATANLQEHRIVEMEHQIRHLTELIDQLLTMTRLDSVSEQKLRRVNVNELVQNIEIAMQTAFTKKGLKLNVELDSMLPPIKADSLQLSQALSNIVGNALQFTPRDGQISIRTAVRDGYVTVQVEDSGVGISPDDLPFIFERFYRADKARTSGTSSGAGLGLAIARKIVEMHWGHIEVESVLGVGTTFTVVLPPSND